MHAATRGRQAAASRTQIKEFFSEIIIVTLNLPIKAEKQFVILLKTKQNKIKLPFHHPVFLHWKQGVNIQTQDNLATPLTTRNIDKLYLIQTAFFYKASSYKSKLTAKYHLQNDKFK